MQQVKSPTGIRAAPSIDRGATYQECDYGPIMKRSLTGAIICIVVLVGCSSPSSSKTSGAKSPSASPSQYKPTAGADAALIAGHIPGCTAVSSGNVGKGGPDLTSTASCTLSGHTLIIDSFMSNAGLANLRELLKGTETYYATGTTGWLVFLADQGATPDTTTLQMQLTNDAGGLTRQSLDHNTPTPSSLDAQQQLTTTVAHALNGTVVHAPA